MDQFVIPQIANADLLVSTFSVESHPKQSKGGMFLTDRIDALNFRIRESKAGYKTDWHVAVDPTLIIVQQGIIRISLQNGDFKDFGAGDMFIARDYLPEHVSFDNTIHGHRAEVIGDQDLRAIHIKLEQR